MGYMHIMTRELSLPFESMISKLDWSSPCIIKSKPFDFDTNLVCITVGKFWRIILTLDFCLSRKIQVTLIQSSTNDRNHLALKLLGICKVNNYHNEPNDKELSLFYC